MALTRLLALALAALAGLARADLPPPVARALRSAGIPQSHVSLVAQRVDARRPALAHNARQAMSPASVIKLVTTYAALEVLGPAHTWRTEARAAAPLERGVLAGDLYLKGSGDPRLTLESFWRLLRQLRARGVREIRGDLVVDRSQFDIPPVDPGSFDREPLRAYNVGPDALLLNYKAVRVDFLPDAASGVVTVLAEPHPPQLELLNLLQLTGGECGDWKEGLRADLTRHGARSRLVFTGAYPAACGEKTWNLGVLDHREYLDGLFRQLWQELGGELTGTVRDGRVPPDARLMGWIDSPALAEIVRDINKWSNNVMARQLFLSLGAARGQLPARSEDGEATVRAWLEGKALAMPELVLENGSGLSRVERISAQSLNRLLLAAWRSSVMPEFVASLPLVGVDGTMRRRLPRSGVTGSAHVKTGSLEGVRAIAGYLLDRRGRRWSVVLMVNDERAGASQAAQDALLEWLWAR